MHCVCLYNAGPCGWSVLPVWSVHDWWRHWSSIAQCPGRPKALYFHCGWSPVALVPPSLYADDRVWYGGPVPWNRANGAWWSVRDVLGAAFPGLLDYWLVVDWTRGIGRPVGQRMIMGRNSPGTYRTITAFQWIRWTGSSLLLNKNPLQSKGR